MRLSIVVVVTLGILTGTLYAAPVRVTVVTKEGRHAGTLPGEQVEVEAGPRKVKVPWAEIASVHFGETDVVRTRQGKRVKGVVNVEGWTLKEQDAERPLSRDGLRFIVPRIPLGTVKKGQIVDAAAANGMTYHVRVPEKYDAAKGGRAIVLFHGSNAYSADYLKGITQRWPKLAADYVLIGIDGEWPSGKDPDAPPAYNYTYVSFVGKSKYKGFPGTDRESPALVAETLAEIKQQLKLTKVFATGHSQGGFLVYSCLMNYPDLFAGGMPIAAGLIFQAEPDAYEDAAIRKQQRKLAVAILHGDKDPLVAVSMAKSAHESFLHEGFPMLRLMIAKGAAHAFIALPFEEGIRWLESMTSDDPKALVASAQRAFAQKEYRDSLAYLRRAKEVDRAGTQSVAAKTLNQKIEQLAAAPAEALETKIKAAKGDGWVSEFDAFRQQFELTGAAAAVMAEHANLRKSHDPPAEKLWSDARRELREGNKDEGYRLCEEIVGKYYASSYYRYAKQSLKERR